MEENRQGKEYPEKSADEEELRDAREAEIRMRREKMDGGQNKIIIKRK